MFGITPRDEGWKCRHPPLLWCVDKESRNLDTREQQNSDRSYRTLNQECRGAERSTQAARAKASDRAKETIKTGWRQGTARV